MYNIIGKYADMVKLANTHDSGSCVERLAGSSPVIRTKEGSFLTAFFYFVLYFIDFFAVT